MSQIIVNTIKNKIYGNGRGWCFTPKHFVGIGTAAAIRQVLVRLEQDKFIRRLAQGLYDYPREHDKLGLLPPQMDHIAKAISERDSIRIQPTGAYAANLIGLSEQVPGKVVYLTDGPAKKIKIGRQEIIFKKTTIKNMDSAGTDIGLLIQALKHYGQKNLDGDVMIKVKRFVKKIDQKEIKKNLKNMPEWISSLVIRLVDIK